MSQSSNVDEIVRWLDQFARSVNFSRPGVEGNLGADVAWTIIRGPDASGQSGIMGRCAQGVTPDGAQWPENSDNPWPPDKPVHPGYKTWKEQKYGWGETNRRTNQMLSQVSLFGRTEIQPEQVTLRYGTDQPPTQSYAPTGYMDEADERVTDVQKATWAHEQGRGFYGIGQGDGESVHDVCAEALAQMINEANS